MGLQADQDIGRSGIKHSFACGVGRNEMGEKIVAKIFQKKEAVDVVFGEDGGRRQAESREMAGNGGEDCGIVALTRRSIHQDSGLRPTCQSVITSIRRIAGKKSA